jgi:hypothetical protein
VNIDNEIPDDRMPKASGGRFQEESEFFVQAGTYSGGSDHERVASVSLQRPKKRLVIWIIVGITAVYLLGLTPAKHVSVDNAGKPRGVLAHLRSAVQGKKFYKAQVTVVDSEIEFWTSVNGLMSAAERQAQREAQTQSDRIKADLYSKYPGSLADKLREAADDLEAYDGTRTANFLIGQRLLSLITTREALVAKAQ